MDKLQTVSGTIELVGTKFNGSVKLDGKFYNFERGFDYSNVKVGDSVTLTLKPWNFKEKTGVNIVKVEQATVLPKKIVAKKETKVEGNEPQANMKSYLGRDFDKENRGKVRHGLLQPLMPLIATDTITVEQAKKLVSDLTFYVMGE